MDEDPRALMEAYARGVNAFIVQHHNNLPLEFTLLNYKPQPWQPTDSLVIAGYMYQTLTDTWEDEIDRAKVNRTRRRGTRERSLCARCANGSFRRRRSQRPQDGSQASRVDPDDDDDDDDMIPRLHS